MAKKEGGKMLVRLTLMNTLSLGKVFCGTI